MCLPTVELSAFKTSEFPYVEGPDGWINSCWADVTGRL